MENSQKRVRWWPLLLGVIGIIAGLIFIWVIRADRPMQAKYMRTASLLGGATILFLIWVAFLSNLRWRIRVGILFLAVTLGVAAATTLEIRGVTGDLIPIVEFKWKPRHTVAAVPVPPPSVETNAWQKTTGEFLEFYGPNRNASLPGPTLETNWASHPPKLLWKQAVGPAWSGFAVKDGLAITQEQREQNEYVVAYELLTGRTVWTYATEARYSTTIAGEGPRATPTISSNRVFTFGATGILTCLDFASGRLLWSKDTAKENDASVPDWGLASSPLVIDGLVIVSVGGKNDRSLVAYDAETGEFRWGAGSGGADYSSPLLAMLLGERQIIIFNSAGLVAHNFDGQKLWSYPWRGGHPHITPPLVIGTNQVLASSGYGTGAELVQIERDPSGAWTATNVWKSLGIKSKFGPLFLHDGFVYGLDDGMFACIELATGKRRWKDGRFGHGQGLLVDNIILLTTEKGELTLIQPDPERLIQLATFPLFSDKTWNPPALAGEFLLVRNHKEAACLQLKLRPPLLARQLN